MICGVEDLLFFEHLLRKDFELETKMIVVFDVVVPEKLFPRKHLDLCQVGTQLIVIPLHDTSWPNEVAGSACFMQT